MTLRLPKERDRTRFETLLGLSRATIVWSNVGQVVLLLGGVANWVRLDYPRQGWLWAAVAFLAALGRDGRHRRDPVAHGLQALLR